MDHDEPAVPAGEEDAMADAVTRTGPFTGVRVLEASGTRAGRIAGMLLADLGAEVVRAVTAPVPAGGPPDPGELCWDRGKRVVRVASRRLAGIAADADVVLVDRSPEGLRSAGLDADALTAAVPGLIHVWMPPYAPRGRWSELEEDPLLLAAVGGIAGHHPALTDRPVAPVVATTTYIHGAMGAAAVAAGLVGRRRSGGGHAAVVSGLHAAAAQLATMAVEGLDQPVFSPGRAVCGTPCWRIYRCADDRWLFLAALTPALFLRALDALDRMEIMVLPQVAGEFSNILAEDVAGRAVARELEAVFASRSSGHWLEVLAEAGVPCAPVQSRDEWIDGEIVTANDGTVVREHPELGPVTMPGIPVTLSATPGSVGGFPTVEELPEDATGSLWSTPCATRGPVASAGRPRLPLEGVKVIDAATFLAAPFAVTLLADHGADVVKVEPVTADPYRAYPVSFLAVNQRKRGLALDLSRPGGREALLALVRGADILVENFRPGRLERLGLAADRLRRERPGLVHCSVSAYGHAGRYAEAPGFDPVFQCLSGLAAAQGGDGEPVVTAMPAHDTCTGVLAALGALAALYVREETGRGQRVRASLAASSTFLQSAEFTLYHGRPEPITGGPDFPGPHPGHRYHACSDGWLAVAATTPVRMTALLEALGIDDAERIEEALRHRTVEDAVALLADHGVPACRVAEREGYLHDPFLVENGFSHVVEHGTFGRIRVVRGYADWGTDDGRAAARWLEAGQHSRWILAEAGITGERLASLLGDGTVVEPAAG
jgi:crotonobetainyl-CoA:carnitine CoA-transferase CaiB-like acyl-CoA transferase